MNTEKCKVCGKPIEGKIEDICTCNKYKNIKIAETVSINEKFGVSDTAEVLVE
jgi:hypothetical protein